MTTQAGVRLSEAQRRVVAHGLVAPAIVEAGAGTGKTFTIVERVAELHESGRCPADKILLLTFGRKAAAELRDRIIGRLGEAAPDCSTFHAFAWSIVSTHLYDIGLSPDTVVIDDAEARVHFRTAFDEYLLDPQAGDSGFPLRQFNCDELRAQLFRLRQQLKERSITIETFRDLALAAAAAFGRVSFRELREPYAVRQGYKELASVDDGELAAEVEDEKRRVEAAYEIFSRFDRLLAEHHALTYADILERAESAVRDSRSLRDDLRARYRYCIVDEYQDTDRAQHRFLEALFGAGLEGVMVVGDVLQSIYSFRGAQPANVEAFKRAAGAITYPLDENRRSRQEILDLAHHAVTPAHPDARALTGERGAAAEQIVHVSSLWSQPQAHEAAGRDGPAQPAPYIPVDEARRLEADAVAARIRQLLNGQPMVDAADGTREPIAPRHIAILSRTKRNVQPVTEALLAAGIAFRLVGGVGFYDAPEVRDALAWLRLLADPFDGHAVARALQSSAVGASDAAAAALARHMGRDETAFARRVLVEEIEGDDEVARTARKAAARLRELLDALAPHAALPLLGALRAVLDQTGLQRNYETGIEMRAPQALANLQKLEALARGFAQDNAGAQPADFVTFVDELERIDFDEREADVPAYDAVTISTIHSAKGLEWPIVFVLSVWPQLAPPPRLRLGTSGALLYSDNADGSRSFHYLAETRGADADGVVPRKAGGADDEEERRLFYVALTRARDRLFLSGPRRRPSKDQPLGSLDKFLARACDWMHERRWPTDEPLAQTAPPPLAMQLPSRHAQAKVSRTELGPELAEPSSLPFALSYSLVAAFDLCPRRATYRAVLRLPGVADLARRRRARRGWVDADPASLVDDDPSLDEGEYGELLHKMLELWALARRDGADAAPSARLLAEAAACLGVAPLGSQASAAERALERVAHELRDWTMLAAEAPFTLDFGSEGKPLLVSGYLDLLARDGKGRGCVVDYKTGGVRGEKLGLQLALYRAAAKAAYAVDDPLCFAGRITNDAFTLEPVMLVSDGELLAHIVAARDGLLARDVRPRAGAWCHPCGYRAAPCMDYERPKA